MHLKKGKSSEAKMGERDLTLPFRNQASSAPPPPPPYLSTDDASLPSQQMKQEEQTSPPPYPAQSQSIPSPCRVFQTYNANKKGTEIRIAEGSAPAPIQDISTNSNTTPEEPYTIHVGCTKPHMRFLSTTTGREFATAHLSTCKRVIEFSLHGGQPISLSVPRSRRKGVMYTSPNLPNSASTLTWKSKHTWRNLTFTCLRSEGDAAGDSAVPLAQFKSNCWSGKKAGTVELFPPLGEGTTSGGKGGDDEDARVVEEILAIGLAMIQWERVQLNSVATIVAVT